MSLLAGSLPDPASGLGQRPGRRELLGAGTGSTSMSRNPGIAGFRVRLAAAYEANGQKRKSGDKRTPHFPRAHAGSLLRRSCRDLAHSVATQ